MQRLPERALGGNSRLIWLWVTRGGGVCLPWAHYPGFWAMFGRTLERPEQRPGPENQRPETTPDVIAESFCSLTSSGFV